jgi:hypothetical protein
MANGPRPDWAARLESEREARGWGMFEMARRLREAVGMTDHPTRQVRNMARQILSHEKGDHFPRTWAQAYAATFGMDYDDLFPAPPQDPADASVGNEQCGDVALIEASSLHDHTAEPEDDMRRRKLLSELLQLGGWGILASTQNDLVRQSLDRILGVIDSYNAEDWELACMDHAYSVMTQPPAEVRRALLVDLAAVDYQLGHAAAADKPALQRVAARLAALFGNVLTRLGDYEAARCWWTTARHAADASGDTTLSVWVRGKEAAFGLYAPRPLQSVIALTENARRRDRGRPSIGMLCAIGSQAQALAVLGHADAAHRALHELVDIADRTTISSGYVWGGWTEDSLPFAAAKTMARRHVTRRSPRGTTRTWRMSGCWRRSRSPVTVGMSRRPPEPLRSSRESSRRTALG